MKPVYNDFTDIRKSQAARILSSYVETDIVLRANDEIKKAQDTKKAMSTSTTPGFETAEGKDGKIVGKPDKPKVGDVKVELEKSEDGDADGAQFDKAQSPEEKAKMEKVMKEFKEGTLKTSAGEKVTDRKQALAIAISESKSIKKGETMKVDTKEMIEEHKKLVNTLESPSHKDDKEEAKKQKKELGEYKEELKKAFDIVGL